ncbi:hypothetical protein BKA62DRAFT_671330 [Auriculariales sp. MPI-PUGE-AT-0066]|nr:hypothetical protein BKA62DRAFT_671330 [Auriculariales sp. MPI-PUGE-AT-0066]
MDETQTRWKVLLLLDNASRGAVVALSFPRGIASDLVVEYLKLDKVITGPCATVAFVLGMMPLQPPLFSVPRVDACTKDTQTGHENAMWARRRPLDRTWNAAKRGDAGAAERERCGSCIASRAYLPEETSGGAGPASGGVAVGDGWYRSAIVGRSPGGAVRVSGGQVSSGSCPREMLRDEVSVFAWKLAKFGTRKRPRRSCVSSARYLSSYRDETCHTGTIVLNVAVIASIRLRIGAISSHARLIPRSTITKLACDRKASFLAQQEKAFWSREPWRTKEHLCLWRDVSVGMRNEQNLSDP